MKTDAEILALFLNHDGVMPDELFQDLKICYKFADLLFGFLGEMSCKEKLAEKQLDNLAQFMSRTHVIPRMHTWRALNQHTPTLFSVHDQCIGLMKYTVTDDVPTEDDLPWPRFNMDREEEQRLLREYMYIPVETEQKNIWLRANGLID